MFELEEITQLVAAIDELNIIDPAVGSGAFPMGILHKLVHMLRRLDPGNHRWRQQQLATIELMTDSVAQDAARTRVEELFARNEDDYGRKLFLIENCIYGVDIQPIAVQIAKLRCFISLIVDQRIQDEAPNRGILPLPNLETKFVAANSLLALGAPGQQQGLRDAEIDELERELQAVRHRHFMARTRATKEKIPRARPRDPHTDGTLLRASRLPPTAAELLASWDPYDQNGSAHFFDQEWMFGVAGFDIVIGNPPYVRQEKIKDQKRALKQQYSCYTGVADLYVYFYERGVRLLCPDGVLIILSNKYMRAGYGKPLRGFLASKHSIELLIDFGDAPVFDAIAYPSIILMRNVKPEGRPVRALEWEPGPEIADFAAVFTERHFDLAQHELGDGGWHIADPAVLRLLEKLRQAGSTAWGICC